MDSLMNILDKDEIIIYTLRKLYKDSGYKKYRMSKFEEYDLYVNNKDFLISQNIITFTDIEDDGECIETFFETWMEHDKNYYDEHEVNYIRNKNKKVVAVSFAATCND